MQMEDREVVHGGHLPEDTHNVSSSSKGKGIPYVPVPLHFTVHDQMSHVVQDCITNGAEPSMRWGRKEKVVASYGIVIISCIIALPRLGGTILSNFTQEVLILPDCMLAQSSSLAVFPCPALPSWADTDQGTRAATHPLASSACTCS